MNALFRERQQDAESEERAKSAKMLADELLAALKKRDLGALALFAPMVTDYNNQIPCGAGLSVFGKRHQTIAEVMLSHVSGSTDFAAMVDFILDVAFAVEADAPRRARTLLNAITVGYGDEMAEVTQ